MTANASPQSSCKETHWPFTPQWTLGAQPLEACVAGPVKETFKSGGAGIQSQQLFLQTDGSQHDHSLFKVKSHRGAHSPTHCKSAAGRLHLQRSPSAPGQPVLTNADSIRQTGAESNVMETFQKHTGWHGPMLWCSGLMILWKDTQGGTLSRGTGGLSVSHQGAVTEGRWRKGAVKTDG